MARKRSSKKRKPRQNRKKPAVAKTETVSTDAVAEVALIENEVAVVDEVEVRTSEHEAADSVEDTTAKTNTKTKAKTKAKSTRKTKAESVKVEEANLETADPEAEVEAEVVTEAEAEVEIEKKPTADKTPGKRKRRNSRKKSAAARKKAEAEKAEAERLEAEKAEKAEAERVEAEKAEAEKVEAEKAAEVEDVAEQQPVAQEDSSEELAAETAEEETLDADVSTPGIIEDNVDDLVANVNAMMEQDNDLQATSEETGSDTFTLDPPANEQDDFGIVVDGVDNQLEIEDEDAAAEYMARLERATTGAKAVIPEPVVDTESTESSAGNDAEVTSSNDLTSEEAAVSEELLSRFELTAHRMVTQLNEKMNRTLEQWADRLESMQQEMLGMALKDSSSTGALDWEAQKKLLLNSYGESDESASNTVGQLDQVEHTSEEVESVEEPAENNLVETLEILDETQSEKIAELKADLTSKLREAEIELSINRAKLSQQRVALDQKQTEIERREAHLRKKFIEFESAKKKGGFFDRWARHLTFRKKKEISDLESTLFNSFEEGDDAAEQK